MSGEKTYTAAEVQAAVPDLTCWLSTLPEPCDHPVTITNHAYITRPTDTPDLQRVVARTEDPITVCLDCHEMVHAEFTTRLTPTQEDQ